MTVVNGQVTDVTALELPSGGRSGQISREAEPILHDEALSAQSASIDGVSGATYTSLAYEQSLQAALDAAGLTPDTHPMIAPDPASAHRIGSSSSSP